MRIVIGALLLAATMPPSPPVAARQTDAPAGLQQPASTMSELMVKIIYPASDAIFYITTREPKTEAEWGDLQGKALAVAESANLLMMPGRARDQDRWMQDAKLMLDAGRAAFRAAKAKDVAALDALNDQLYTSCTSCHRTTDRTTAAGPRRVLKNQRAPPSPAASSLLPSRPSCPSSPSSPSRPSIPRGPLEASGR